VDKNTNLWLKRSKILSKNNNKKKSGEFIGRLNQA
jgi:hypothetical protein